ncbi:MAG TPA: response regulator [Patescibacteria group bacterium]|nr:response regulator [Patescibacteria group bacterium]
MNDHRPHILMVEDDPIVSLQIKRILEKNYSVDHASGYDEAFSFLQSDKIDLILLDINLGFDSLGGVELLGHIREDSRFDNIKIFAVTSEPLDEVQGNFLVGGFDRYISKPVQKEELLGAINEALLQR